MLELLYLGISEIFQFSILFYMLIGVTGGIIAAAIPGFTITMSVVLLLPFTFGMTPVQGIATMVAVFVGGLSGGLITAALLGIPGTPSAVATTFDGFPMVKNGEPGKALSVGIWASCLGSFFSMIILISVAPQVAELALLLGPWEYFSLIAFALTIIATITGESFIKGLIAGLLGLFISTIGVDPMSGVDRFTFGIDTLGAGVPFLVVLIGIYATSQLLSELEEKAKSNKKVEQLVESKNIKVLPIKALKIVLSQPWNLIRSSIIGTIIGAIPGAGGSIANILAYDRAKKGSDHPEDFGTGIVDGVIASESGNNSTAGGGLIPMIALGIPGSAVSAVMIAALMIHGIKPGPMLIQNEPSLVGSIFVGFFVATLMMVFVQFIGARIFLKITSLPKYILIPSVLTFCVMGSYVLNNRYFDLYTLFVIGILGYILYRYKFARAPIILGVILGPIAETNLRRAFMTDSDWTLFFTRPISLGFILLALLSVILVFREQIKNMVGNN